MPYQRKLVVKFQFSNFQKFAFFILFVSSANIHISAQNKLEWSEERRLVASDFLAPAPNASAGQTAYTSTVIEFGFQNYQLFFSNLNSNVSCFFLPTSSWLDEGDQDEQLLKFANVQWDIQELAARQLRKKFIENRMKLNQNKMRLLYEEVSKESTELQSQFSKETDFGRNPEQLLLWEQKVKELLNGFADYCRTCKAPKKKKKKKR